MSLQRKLIQLPLVGIILLGLLVVVYLVAWKHFSKPDASARIIKHKVGTHPEDTLKYWTKNKMRKAKPAKMPKVDAPDPGKKQPRRPSV